jgi:hypothetical protein
MEKEFVTYEQALALKELGFDERCLGKFDKYNDNILDYGFTGVYPFDNLPVHLRAPTFSQTLRWFRKKYSLNGIINHYPNTKLWDFSVHNLEWNGKELMEYTRKEDRNIKFSTYEEAESACLDKLIEIIKNK